MIMLSERSKKNVIDAELCNLYEILKKCKIMDIGILQIDFFLRTDREV